MDDEVEKSVYALFAGVVDQNSVQRIFHGFTGAMSGGVNHIHLLFQSYGGGVSDGVCLYNFFKTLPIDLTLYNVGGVSSAATIAFMGAKARKTSTYATFMLHRTVSPALPTSADRLHAVTHSVTSDDERTEAIIRDNLTLSDEQWAMHRHSDLFLTASQAVACGLAEIGEFAPPFKGQIFNI